MEGWKFFELAEIANVYSGNSIPAREKKEKYFGVQTGVPYIGTKDVGFDHRIDYENGVRIPEKFSSNFKEAPPNSVLVCAEGGSAGRKIAHNEHKVHFGNKLYALVPNENIKSKYIFYYCMSGMFYESFKSLMTGIIGGVSSKKLKSIQFPVAPLPEQERIVAILDEAFAAIDTATANTQKNLANAKELFESQLDKVFENFDLETPEFSLGGLCDLQNGFAFKSKDYIKKSNTLNIRMSNIRPNGQFDPDHNIRFLPDSYLSTYERYQLFEGDLVIAMTDMAGDPKILGVPTLVTNLKGRSLLQNQRVGKLCKFDDRLLVSFLCCFLRTKKMSRFYKQKSGANTLQINLSKKDILSAIVPLPSINEQKNLCIRIEKLENYIKTIEANQNDKLNCILNLKQSLLQKAFTGELTADPKVVDRTLSEASV